MPPQTLAAVAAIVSFAVHGDRVEFRLDHGSAELTWVSPDSFRFRRSLGGQLPALNWSPPQTVRIQVEEDDSAIRMRSNHLEVTVRKRGALVGVRRFDGEPLMQDLSEPRAANGGVVWERAMPPGARLFGLGRRADPGYDWRGKAGEAEVPFLFSSAGWGEYHPGGGPFRFDFTAASRYRIQAPQLDYYFLYGARPKAIFEALHGVAGQGLSVPGTFRGPQPSWASLRDQLLRLTHGFISAMLHQSFDLANYSQAPPELLARARQIGSLVPDAPASSLQLSGFRRQLKTFYAAYEPETREKGHPIWHPLPFQFPDDPECARHADEFMLGDEMLIAPIYDPSGQRSLYLPQGVWTNLETNEVAKGRQTITVKTESLPVFAHNGTIIPLDSEGGMGLHYFPELAAEFFVLETEVNDWTQVHASPAADIYRLQIDSKVARDYQWVIHHVERPASVGFEGEAYREVGARKELAGRTWFYDTEKKNLHVRVHVGAGETNIIHLSW